MWAVICDFSQNWAEKREGAFRWKQKAIPHQIILTTLKSLLRFYLNFTEQLLPWGHTSVTVIPLFVPLNQYYKAIGCGWKLFSTSEMSKPFWLLWQGWDLKNISGLVSPIQKNEGVSGGPVVKLLSSHTGTQQCQVSSTWAQPSWPECSWNS